MLGKKELIRFREFVNGFKESEINRCRCIDEIISINANWSYILRSLLLVSNSHKINKNYLLEKINFMLNNPDYIAQFLDVCRTKVFCTLRECLRNI